MRNSRVPTLIVMICAIVLMAVIPAVSAQEAQSVELVGVIEVITLNTITINQQEVIITRAELNTPLVIGALVQVEGTLNEDGSITAREVNAAPAGARAGEVELVGTVDSISGTTLTVNGLLIDTAGAQITGVIAVGQTVRVHASAVGANTWLAREIEVLDSAVVTPPPVAGEFEIVGTLDSIDGATVTVSGQIIDISNAEINDPLVVGTLVKAHVSSAGGMLVAREIELARGDDGDNVNENTNDNSNENSNDNVRLESVITARQAIEIVRRVYPTTRIRSIERTVRFGGTVVWEVEISGRIELIIDAQTGNILVIDRPGSDDNGNDNSNDNSNDNDGGDDNGNDNSNDNDGGDDNGNDNSNDNDGGDDDSNDNRDDDNDNSGDDD